jgi:hypothetical protein
MHHS